MKKEKLLNELRKAIKDGSLNCELKIDNDYMQDIEYIKFYPRDYEYKINFIDKAYDNNLVNKSAKFIKIIGCAIEY